MPASRTTHPPTPTRPGILAVFVLTLMTSCALPISRDAEPGRDAAGNEGAVTAGHPLAAEAGLAVLQSGGLAMDAAITAAAVLAVARPHMNGVGGDMFLLYHDSATKLTYALNGSGRSGSAKDPRRAEGRRTGADAALRTAERLGAGRGGRLGGGTAPVRHDQLRPGAATGGQTGQRRIAGV